MSRGDQTKAILRLHTRLERVMGDERFNDGRPHGHEIRGLIVAYFWACFEYPKDREARWARTKTLAGVTAHRWGSEHSSWRLKELYRADAPRFEPVNGYRDVRCPAPMLRGPRVGEPCGKRGTYSFRVTDPETGEWEIRGWCSRHEADANAAREVERRTPKREPFPNVGGLLPCYINAKNWPDLYAASLYGWKPPSVGIIADQWPVMTKVVERRLSLRAIDGGGEGGAASMEGIALWSTETAELPALQLVRDV